VKGFPQGVLVLSSYRQFAAQILNGFLDLHKSPVSSTPNQLGKGKFFFSTRNYLLSPVVVIADKYLYFLNVL
jgi:hypothetical protein